MGAPPLLTGLCPVIELSPAVAASLRLRDHLYTFGHIL
jgi:hypothetical protein